MIIIMFYFKLNLKYFQFTSLKAKFSTRVRFAPSPTGLLHVGGLKTALVNFLFAKSTNGNFILRIEDTDRSRLDSNSINHMLKALKWLNITFSEGIINDKPDPNFIQSNRLSLYKSSVNQLVKNNKAYYCFCSSQRLEFLRKEQIRRGENPGYDRKCLNLPKSVIEEKLLQQQDHCVRLKLEDSSPVHFHDIIFGDVTIPLSKVESDPIIFKSDGYPVYHLANVVDDHDMGISHVIRGQEWLISTPKHIILYDAFGWTPPEFAHLPLVVKENGMKISKRDSDFSESFYNIDLLMKKGFTPESVVAWLMSCGGGLTVDWHASITLAQLIEKFSLPRITTHNARLSHTTLLITSKCHIKNIVLSEDYFHRTVEPYLAHNSIQLNYPQFQTIFHKLRQRLTCFEDILDLSYIWKYNPMTVGELSGIITDKHFGDSTVEEVVKEVLNRLVLILQTETDPLSCIDDLHQSLCDKATAMKCIRMAIISRTEGPKISELLVLFSKDELLKRLNSVLSKNPY